MFLQIWMYFDRILSTKWWWRILPVLLRDLQRRNPWSKHTFPVSYLFSCWRITHYGRRRKLWYVSGDHKSWTSWGLIQRFLKCYYLIYFSIRTYVHTLKGYSTEEQTRRKKPTYVGVMRIFLACSPVFDWSSEHLQVKWVKILNWLEVWYSTKHRLGNHKRVDSCPSLTSVLSN